MRLTSRRALWQELHREQNIDRLTGSDPEQVLAMHGLTRPHGKRIADIGYGTGTMARFLASDNEVVSFDIARIDGVQPIERLGETRFDIGICHLVAQHNPPEDIHMLVPRLRPGGRFSIQFAAIEGRGNEKQGELDWLHDPHKFHELLLPLVVREHRNIEFVGNDTARRMKEVGLTWWVFVCGNAEPRDWVLRRVTR
jgi:SAM-dependent methyltransferase